MIKKALWTLFAILAIGIGLYPGMYFIVDRKFGLLSSKSEALLASPIWNLGFYTHIILGGLALLLGWIQFSATLRRKYLAGHRLLGKVYVTSALLSAVAGIGIGFFATGGLVAAAGFIGLGLVWFYTTLMAFRHIKNKQVHQHERMMVYSYAACFAAVMLRIWLPFLIVYFGEFVPAYRVVAWLCWVPNLVVAYFVVRKLGSP